MHYGAEFSITEFRDIKHICIILSIHSVTKLSLAHHNFNFYEEIFNYIDIN